MAAGALLDATPLASAHALRGIGAAVRGWLAGFSALPPEARPRLLLRDGQTPPPGFETAAVPWPSWRLYRLPDPWPRLAVERHLARERAVGEVFHAVQPALTPPTERVAVFCHDVIPLRYERAYLGGPLRAPERREYRRYLARLVGADMILTPSRATADDLVRLAGADSGRIRVVPHGVPPAAAPEGEAPAGPYVLFAGGLEPHKNAWCVIEAAARLRGPTRLVMAGPWSRRGAERLRRRAEAVGAAERTVLLGFVSPGRMETLRRNAVAAVVPSWAEGFGFPVVEAMAAGCPVLAADVPALREAGGEAALYLSPGAAVEWADAIDRLAEDPGGRAEMAAAGRAHAGSLSWTAAAESLLDAYAAVARGAVAARG